MSELFIYNTLTGKKEKFVPLVEGKVGMYVCGPTLYNEPHMGNLRTFINFDMIYRYFLHLGYQVKYVRNITDCGHITNSLGDEVDNIGKAAKEEQLQPLEIVYKYNNKFKAIQAIYNLLPPTIEPTATAHIQEQIEVIEKIIHNGYAYEVNGAVYFDLDKYIKDEHPYGIISGRKVEDLLVESRELKGQDEKRSPADFGLWKRANPEDMQIWRSPWGDGNPGWHIECTAMSTKYLGEEFDIHGGGMDLKFPHHEDEIAQSCGAGMKNPARYWMHANMLNVNGKKMSKSFHNYFLPMEIIEGTTDVFQAPYSPQVIRFFMMMGHYRSDLDFSDKALSAAQIGYDRLTEAFQKVEKLKVSKESNSTELIDSIRAKAAEAMNDDFNTSKLIAELFELSSVINKIYSGELTANQADIAQVSNLISSYFVQVLGINFQSESSSNHSEAIDQLMNFILDIRKQARENKDWTTSDKIRDMLTQANITVKDEKDGTVWTM